MIQDPARRSVRLAGSVTAITDAHHAWAAHVAAGRIGGNPPPPGDILARRLATDAQFARYRAARAAGGAA